MSTDTNEPNASENVSEEIASESASEAEGTQDSSGSSSGDTGIEIDGQVFATEAEALAYAKSQLGESKTKLAVAEAYQAGILDGRPEHRMPASAIPQEAVDEDPDFEQKFYADPKKALRERDEKIEQRILNKVRSANQMTENEIRIWNTFCGLHPDLADFKTDVDLTAQDPTHAAIVQSLLRTKGETEAMNYVAQKTRAKFQAYVAASKTKTVLPRGNSSGPTPTGSAKSVTIPKKDSKPLSMSEQLRQLKSKSHKY